MSTSNLIQAFDIVAGSKIQALKFDKTIIGTITEVINSSTGEYRAEYEAGIFKVYAEDPSIVYEKGQSVYIKIPEGDYSNKKFIEGTVKNSENAEKVIDLKKVPIFAPVKFNLVDKGNNIWQNKEEEQGLINQYITLYKDKGFGRLTATFKGISDIYQDYGFKDVLQVAQMSGTPFNRSTGAQESVFFNIENSISFEFFDNNNAFTCESAYIEFGEYIDFTTTPYYLVINTPKGNSGNNIVLQGVLYHEGKDITNQAITYQWYKEKIDAVDVDAGIGWQKLSNETRSALQVAAAAGQTQYKLIAFYEEGKSVSQIITTNPSPGYIIVNQDNGIVTHSDGNTITTIYYYTPLGEDLPTFSSNYEYLTIKAIDEYGNIYTTIWKQRTYSAKINFIGDDLYHYNANSDISAEIVNIEHTLEPVYIEDNKLIKSISWYILGEEKPLVIGQYYNPEASMMKDIWVDNNNILHYMIKDTYAIQNWNNTFKIKIEKIDTDKPETTLKEVFFIKDGQQGTNGTDYCCIVRPVAADGVTLLSEAEAIITSQSELNLRAFVYNKGKLINDGNFTWSEKAECLEIISNKDKQICKIRHNDNINAPQYHLITLKADINGNILYYNYPVCYTTGNKENIVELSYPKYVQYTAAGVSPEWLDKEIICEIANNSNLQINPNNEDLLTIINKKIKPSATFNFADGIGVIVINKNLYCPVMMYLNTFGNEAINDWDGTSIEIEGGAVLAPQVGAGIKETTSDGSNVFTGVIMGKDSTIANTGNFSNTGLFGYKQGKNSFGLMSNGNAYFGSSPNNRIWFFGDSATIEGGGGGDSETGMTINLNDSKGEAIKIGDGVFQVDYDGRVQAQSGNIAGWEINIDDEKKYFFIGGETTLHSTEGITTNTLKIKQGNTNLGKIGFIESNSGDDYLGITSDLYGIILEGKQNIRLSALDETENYGHIYLTAKSTIALNSTQNTIIEAKNLIVNLTTQDRDTDTEKTIGTSGPETLYSYIKKVISEYGITKEEYNNHKHTGSVSIGAEGGTDSFKTSTPTQ